MTFYNNKNNPLNEEEWGELVALKNAINDDPASVHYDEMERFTSLLVRSFKEQYQP